MVRTDNQARKQEGISFLLIDLQSPGITIRPITSLDGDHHLNEVFFDDVRVPVGNLVGEENQGWSLITNQLNHERVTLCSSGIVERQLDDVRRWAQETKLADGRRVIDQEWVQLNLARVHAQLESLTLPNWTIAWPAPTGAAPRAPARGRRRATMWWPVMTPAPR